MTAPRLPCLGSVAWVELKDANGFRKLQPVVVVTHTAQIAPGKPVRVVAITTRLPAILPDDQVLLSCDPQGKARSGLRRRCEAVASWQGRDPVGLLGRGRWHPVAGDHRRTPGQSDRQLARPVGDSRSRPLRPGG